MMFTLLLLLLLPVAASDQAGLQSTHRLLLTVKDETGIPVAAAKVSLLSGSLTIHGETDKVGRCELVGWSAGLYEVRVEKQGFYAAKLTDVRLNESTSLALTLTHEQELRDAVDVTYSPPLIDPAKTTASEQFNTREILNLPYPTTRDYRTLLPYLPRVHRDATGQIHINGSASYQIYYQLDGFNISHPTSGLLELRVSSDALRAIEVQSSRYSAEYGKASGGVLNLNTGMGDDRFRIAATDFVPSFQSQRGINLNAWTPRLSIFGPIKKQRAWYFTASDADLNLNILTELPEGADRNLAWRFNNLLKAQVNTSATNILTTSFVSNHFNSPFAGLSRFTPQETSLRLRQDAYLANVRNQTFRASGLMLEAGFAFSEFLADAIPQGTQMYVLRPDGASGGFYRYAERDASRVQGITNLTLPPLQIPNRGRHELRLGLDIDRTTYHLSQRRQPIQVLRANNTLARRIMFSNDPPFDRSKLDLSGYVQDRWTISQRAVVEAGLRLDRDSIVKSLLLSPRLATSVLLTRDGETKLVLGAGLFHDATNLEFITRPTEGRRTDAFYAADGRTLLRAPVETSFFVNEQMLRTPRFFNWSAELERKLPAAIYLRVEYTGKRGQNGIAFDRIATTDPTRNVMAYNNNRRDKYDALTVTMRRAYKEEYALFASYTRSSARTNAVIDLMLDTILFTQQSGGPVAWDAPHRVISWGWLPLVKKFDFAYALEWRSGYPFSLINQDQQLVGAPNTRRFPNYFALNMHVERRFPLFGLNWAVRAGFNNITNRPNASEINNNIDSAQFLQLGGIQGRTLNARIRFLGRK
ncbi:MAG TPA: carboxypeptidase regulatory-like domain-containing protein [Blastocatellia bacterium]|nr:carboxypeptidase regulatory-like domain-containing protein [Blastocatellia bacterium]